MRWKAHIHTRGTHHTSRDTTHICGSHHMGESHHIEECVGHYAAYITQTRGARIHKRTTHHTCAGKLTLVSRCREGASLLEQLGHTNYFIRQVFPICFMYSLLMVDGWCGGMSLGPQGGDVYPLYLICNVFHLFLLWWKCKHCLIGFFL